MNLTQTVDTALSSFRSAVTGYLGSAMVDLSTGMLLDADCVVDPPGDVLDVMAAAAAEVFHGRTLTQAQQAWSRHGVDATAALDFREVVACSAEFVTIMVRVQATPEMVAVVVCRREASLGMLLAQARQAVDGLDTP